MSPSIMTLAIMKLYMTLALVGVYVMTLAIMRFFITALGIASKTFKLIKFLCTLKKYKVLNRSLSIRKTSYELITIIKSY
jgi:hypothetical protein